jgi:hypothetical protein
MAQHGTAAAANQEEIKRLKKDKGIPVHAARSSPSLNGNSHLPDECNAGHPRCRGSERRTQIDNLNSEPAAAMAEWFKLVATVHGEKRRHNQKIFLGRQDQERGGEDQRCQSPRT